MVELLVVLVIIGVMALVIGPSFTTGSDVGRVKTATRGLMQMSRYARTMALLHQTPVELILTSDGGLRVEQVEGQGESIVSAKAFAPTNTVIETSGEEDEPDQASRSSRREASEPSEDGSADDVAVGGAGYVMADLNIEKKFDQVVLRFEGYTDSLVDERTAAKDSADADKDEQDGDEERSTVRIRYQSNGTCRPYKVQVFAEGDESWGMTVAVDVLGSAKVQEEEE